MVKAATRDIPQHLKSLAPQFAAVLVYGPNEGLVRERAQQLARQVVADLNDPFNVARLTSSVIVNDPARLADEAAAISMLGGRRLVWVEDADDHVTAPLKAVLDDPKGDALLLLQAGDLPARSSLRTLADTAKNALALPCYEDDTRSLEGLAQALAAEAGLRFDADALKYLSGHVGHDRMVAKGEIEKLILYKASDQDRRITLDDMKAAIGDSGEMTLDDVADAAAAGDLVRLEQSLARAFLQGEMPVSILRAVGRRLMRLYDAAQHMATGIRAEDAVKRLRPPVFFKDVDGYVRQLNRWTPATLMAAVRLLVEAEEQTKTTVLPADTICARACLRIANAARQAR